jgi:hypothetical protein
MQNQIYQTHQAHLVKRHKRVGWSHYVVYNTQGNILIITTSKHIAIKVLKNHLGTTVSTH